MLHTIKISGTGTVTPGEYEGIRVSGSGKLFGPITCNEFKVSGHASAQDALTCELAKLSGSFKTEGDLNAKTVKVSGSFKTEGDVKANEMYVNGMAKVIKKYINADYIEVNGSLKNDLEINVDHLVVNGLIDAKDIVGTTIEILKNGSFSISKGFFFFGKNITLNKAETITCENLYARNLKCEKICAEDITLIECNVEYIECNGILRIDNLSKVKLIEGDCEIIHA